MTPSLKREAYKQRCRENRRAAVKTSNEKTSLEKEGGRGREGQPFTPPRATPATMNLLRNR